MTANDNGMVLISIKVRREELETFDALVKTKMTSRSQKLRDMIIKYIESDGEI